MCYVPSSQREEASISLALAFLKNSATSLRSSGPMASVAHRTAGSKRVKGMGVVREGCDCNRWSSER